MSLDSMIYACLLWHPLVVFNYSLYDSTSTVGFGLVVRSLSRSQDLAWLRSSSTQYVAVKIISSPVSSLADSCHVP